MLLLLLLLLSAAEGAKQQSLQKVGQQLEADQETCTNSKDKADLNAKAAAKAAAAKAAKKKRRKARKASPLPELQGGFTFAELRGAHEHEGRDGLDLRAEQQARGPHDLEPGRAAGLFAQGEERVERDRNKKAYGRSTCPPVKFIWIAGVSATAADITRPARVEAPRRRARSKVASNRPRRKGA